MFFYEVFDVYVLAGKYIILADGRCLKIKEKCGDARLYIAVEHKYIKELDGNSTGNISYYRVIDNDGKEIFGMKKNITYFSDLKTEEFCTNFSFKNNYKDYFEVSFSNNIGAMSLTGQMLVPPQYSFVYIDEDKNGEMVFFCRKYGEKANFYRYSMTGKVL